MSTKAQTRVLIVEDEPMIAMHLRQVLEEMGFDDVECASSLPAARNAMGRDLPGLALLDINIANDLVFPLARELADAGVPFIFSSGRTHGELPIEWRDCPIVAKPIDAAALEREIDALVGSGLLRFVDNARDRHS
jgi:DNA-binding response OmpR family regulator